MILQIPQFNNSIIYNDRRVIHSLISDYTHLLAQSKHSIQILQLFNSIIVMSEPYYTEEFRLTTDQTTVPTSQTMNPLTACPTGLVPIRTKV